MLFLTDDIHPKRDNECRLCTIYTLFVRPSLITGKTSNKRRPPITPKSWTYCNIGVCNHELSSTNLSTYNNIYEIGGGVSTIF